MLNVVKQNYEKAEEVSFESKKKFPEAAQKAVELLVLSDSERGKLREKEREQRNREKEAELARNKADRDAKLRQIESEETDKSSRNREYALKGKSDLLRFGYGGAQTGNLVKIGDSELDKNYGSGMGAFVDIAFKEYYYLRGFYKQYKMESLGNLAFDSSRTSPPGLATLTQYGGDFGVRFNLGHQYLLYELWEVYLNLGLRFVSLEEKADNGLSKSFMSMGVVTGLTLQFTLSPGFGLFAEYNYGYTPVGDAAKNVDGHQLYAGITIRTRVTP
jgi:hypothetical protein